MWDVRFLLSRCDLKSLPGKSLWGHFDHFHCIHQFTDCDTWEASCPHKYVFSNLLSNRNWPWIHLPIPPPHTHTLTYFHFFFRLMSFLHYLRPLRGVAKNQYSDIIIAFFSDQIQDNQYYKHGEIINRWGYSPYMGIEPRNLTPRLGLCSVSTYNVCFYT